jgi:vacuolar-type H+-ATPase subunit I/STV1
MGFPSRQFDIEVSATQRIERLVAPEFSADLNRRDLEALREMRDECSAVEHSVSYTRRLAQGRFEILSAERTRREEGGSVHDVVADLPRILGDERGRASAGNARVTTADEPLVEIDWGPQSHLIADDSLATLDTLGDDDLAAMVDELSEFERELSEFRRELHRVLDSIEHEIATRAAADVG